MDKSQAKKYTKVAVTLGVIAGGSALLIGLANIITAGPIAQNELNKKLESIKVVYGEDAKYGDENIIAEEMKETYPHLISFYNAKDANGVELGNVFVTDGTNNFGQIKMAIGINVDNTFGKISMIINGQTTDAVMDNYVGPWNEGKIDFDDTSCGGTFGATLINEMGKEALSYYKNVIKGEGGGGDGGETETRPFLTNIYGENAKYSEEITVTNDAYPNVKSYYVASSKNDVLLGHVFVLEGTNTFGPIKMSVGINADGTVGKIFLIENGQSNGKDKVLQEEYVDKYNKGEIGFNDVSCGATVGATLVNELGNQALTYYKGEINRDITNFEPYCAEIFGSEIQYTRHAIVIDGENPAIKDQWNAFDANTGKNIGRVYHGELDHVHLMVGINKAAGWNKPQTLAKIFFVNPGQDDASKEAKEFVTKVNNGEIDLTQEDANATGLIKTIREIVKQANGNAAKFKITDPEDVTGFLVKTFGNESYCERTYVNDLKFPNVIEYWNVRNSSRELIGRTYHIEIPGQHGAMHGVVGVKLNGRFNKIALTAMTPDETANKALQAYLDGMNDGTIDVNSNDVIQNGASGSSTGARTMAQIALKHYGGTMLTEQYLAESFGKDVAYVDHTAVNDEEYPHVVEFWHGINKDNTMAGRVYHVALPGQHATIHANVSVTPDGNFHHIYLVNKAPNEYGDKLQRYVDNLNRGDISLDDDVHNGASASSSGVRDIAREAVAHAKAHPILDVLPDLTHVNALYEGDVTLESHRRVFDKAYPNVSEQWTAKDNKGNLIGAAYHCAFPGKHSVMHITVSVNQTAAGAKLGKIILINKAPNKYGEILQQYVDDLNAGKIDINDDIHNGASSSSGAVQTMVQQALKHYGKHKFEVSNNLTDKLTSVFENATFGERKTINSLAQGNLIASWDVKDNEGNLIGRVYHGTFAGEHSVMDLLIGVNANGSLHKIFWANSPIGGPFPPHVQKYAKLAQAYIDGLNDGSIHITDDVHNGASGTTGAVVELTKQALNHYQSNPITINKGE